MNFNTIFLTLLILFSLSGCGGSEVKNPTSSELIARDMMFYKGVDAYFKNDYVSALGWYRKAADQGHSKAQYNLGLLYDTGSGVDQNHKKALKWYRKAAEQGVSEAQFNLAVGYHRGHGVQQDYRKALKWYKKSAKQGDAQAQYNLGLLYDTGLGVDQDYKKALKWYTKSAKQGDVQAQFNLGALLHSVFNDIKQAVKWYHKASKQGHSRSQFNLGNAYYLGDGGLQKNKYKAYKYWSLAAKKGNLKAQSYLDTLCKEESPWVCK